MAEVFRTTFRVRLDDVDYARVLYFARQIHFCMVALEDFFRDGLGLPWQRMLDEDHLVMPTVNVQVSYHHPLKYEDEGQIAVTVGRIGTRSARFDYEVTHTGSGRRTCTAQHSVAFADTRSWKTCPIPDRYRRAFERFLVPRSAFDVGPPEETAT